MKCECCENESSAGAGRCPACGASVSQNQMLDRSDTQSAAAMVERSEKSKESLSLPKGMRFCTNCGTAVSANAIQCPKCGEPLHKASCAGPKQRFVFILLALFLGLFGIHDFYAGYMGRGVAQLLCTLIIGWLIVPIFIQWIFILIEICVVTVDVDGNPLV